MVLVLPILAMPGASTEPDEWTAGEYELSLTMRDGTEIETFIAIPGSHPPAHGFPAIVIIHGYGGSADRGEAREAAAHDYIGLAYSTRGFGQSTGHMDVAGPESIADLIEILDWMRDDSGLPIDPDSIGVTGASYGGGHSIQIATHPEAGVAATAPIVPWSDLEQALRPNGAFKLSYTTGFYATGNGLVQGGGEPEAIDQADGTWRAHRPTFLEPMDPVFAEFADEAPRRQLYDTYDPAVHRWFAEGLLGVGTADVEAAFAERSAIHRVHLVDKPIFLIQGMNDDLFPGDHAIDFFEEVPHDEKCLYLGYIGHPRGESDGDAPEVRYVRGLLYDWFDYHLKGIGAPPCQPDAPIIVANTPWNGQTHTIARWTHGEEGQVVTVPRPYGNEPNYGVIQNTYAAGIPDDAAVAFAMEGACPDCADVYRDLPGGTPADTLLLHLHDVHGEPVVLLGTPRASLVVQSTGTEHQLAVKLWDRDPDGSFTLVTRGITVVDDNLPGIPTRITFDLQPYHYRWEPGHDIYVSISSADFPTYLPVKAPFTTIVHMPESKLILPFV